MSRCVTADSDAAARLETAESLESGRKKEGGKEEDRPDSQHGFPLGRKHAKFEMSAISGMQTPGNIYSCYRATLKGDCVV